MDNFGTALIKLFHQQKVLWEVFRKSHQLISFFASFSMGTNSLFNSGVPLTKRFCLLDDGLACDVLSTAKAWSFWLFLRVGLAFKCKRCGFQADRHLVAAWNIAAKLPMCRPLPLAAKATREAFKAEVERIVIKC